MFVKELGISESGKRKLMCVKVDIENLNNEQMRIPESRKEFEKDDKESDPFLDDLILKRYDVPADIIELLSSSPTDDKEGDIKKKFLVSKDHPLFNVNSKVYDLKHLMKKNGLPMGDKRAFVYFVTSSFKILAHGTRHDHDFLESLLMTIGQGPAYNYVAKGQILEVDQAENKNYHVMNLFRLNPRLVRNFGVTSEGSWLDFAKVENESGVLDVNDDGRLTIEFKDNGKVISSEFGNFGSFSNDEVENLKVTFLSDSETKGRVYIMVLEEKSE